MRRVRSTLVTTAVLAGIIASGDAGASGGAAVPAPEVALPPPNATFDYQLGGAYPPDEDVTVVVRDRTDAPEPGRYNVCYVNAFQTQPDEASFWVDHPRLLLQEDGVAITDPDWPDEQILAPVGPRRRQALFGIVGPWIDQCAADGFDAVEFDNLDTFIRFPDRVWEAHVVEFATRLAKRAHAVGLAVAQKNTIELLGRRDEIGFDFAVVEECGTFEECDGFAVAYRDLVFDIEYDDEGLAAACAAELPISVIRRDPELAPAGDPAHVRATC